VVHPFQLNLFRQEHVEVQDNIKHPFPVHLILHVCDDSLEIFTFFFDLQELGILPQRYSYPGHHKQRSEIWVHRKEQVHRNEGHQLRGGGHRPEEVADRASCVILLVYTAMIIDWDN
jgi:hypothetical protein